MRKLDKFLLISTALGTGLIFLSSISIEIKPNETKANELTIHPTPINIFPTPDYPRLLRMQHLLGGSVPNGYKEYKKLCAQATTHPQIGMTIDQSRNTTWCFPHQRNKTTTINGESVQEIYLKPLGDGTSDSRYSPRQYLYFTNDILTTIQE